MSKSKHFFGQNLFGQLISFIPDKIIENVVKQTGSDRYVKKFKTKDHLISMLFCVFAKCTSLRDVSGAMLGLSGKTKQFKLENIPYRSTLSDANKRRDYVVFERIYNELLKLYGHFISDSRIKEVIKKDVKIIDSTVISLFQEILKTSGRKPVNGKRKGGIKAHVIINADVKVPQVVWYSSAGLAPNKSDFSTED